MIQNREQLFDAILKAKLPASLLRIWNDDVPSRLQYTLQNPSSFFEAFVAHPDGFPSPDELLILWQTNGESIVAHLPSTGTFIRYYFEDGPNEFEVLGESYQQMLSELFAKLIIRGASDVEIDECALYLEFEYLPQLRKFVATNPNWEDNTASFIAKLESPAPPPDSLL